MVTIDLDCVDTYTQTQHTLIASEMLILMPWLLTVEGCRMFWVEIRMERPDFIFLDWLDAHWKTVFSNSNCFILSDSGLFVLRVQVNEHMAEMHVGLNNWKPPQLSSWMKLEYYVFRMCCSHTNQWSLHSDICWWLWSYLSLHLCQFQFNSMSDATLICWSSVCIQPLLASGSPLGSTPLCCQVNVC